jgi:hypothetical protein
MSKLWNFVEGVVFERSNTMSGGGCKPQGGRMGNTRSKIG